MPTAAAKPAACHTNTTTPFGEANGKETVKSGKVEKMEGTREKWKIGGEERTGVEEKRGRWSGRWNEKANVEMTCKKTRSKVS